MPGKSLFEQFVKSADKYHDYSKKLICKGQDVKICQEYAALKRIERKCSYLAGRIREHADNIKKLKNNLSFSEKEDAMYKLFKIMIIVACLNFLPFLFSSCIHARPPKPGPNFVWVAPHILPSGISVPGHWKHIGPAYPGKTWVPGHYTPDGTWRQGHWKKLVSPKPGKIWVPGHHGPRGRWIPGHWR